MADTNLRIWDAVSKTDPSHTKPVEFGRKFTSIDAHWQIMQATKQFGPVGEGWRYEVKHSVERLADTMVLAVADVTVSWRSTDDVPRYFGPIRGTCEMYFKNEKKGRMEVDEDAPKKAMTDALTKGLSHLGFSADVFLGLFDDNRYVQKMKQEFTAGPAGHATRSLEEARADIAAQTGNSTSTYDLAKQRKAIATLVESAKLALSLCNSKTSVLDWWSENSEALITGLPDDEFEKVKAMVKKRRSELPELEKVA